MQTARDFSVSYIDPTTAAWLRTALNAQDLITNGKLEDYYYELYWYNKLSLQQQDRIAPPLLNQAYSYLLSKKSKRLKNIPSEIYRNAVTYRFMLPWQLHCKNPAHFGLPNRDVEGRSVLLTKELFEFKGHRLTIKNRKKVIGVISMNTHREFNVPNMIRLRENALGQWFVSFSYDEPNLTSMSIEEVIAGINKYANLTLDEILLDMFGYDFGVVIGCNDHTGREYGWTKELWARQLQDRERRAGVQSAQALKTGGRVGKLQKRFDSISIKLENRVKHINNLISHQISLNPGIQAIEDTQIRNMMGKAKPIYDGYKYLPNGAAAKKGLTKALRSRNIGALKAKIEEKCDREHKLLIKIPAHNSSCTCTKCDHKAKENRLTQAKFKCVKCEHEDNADTHAGQYMAQTGAHGIQFLAYTFKYLSEQGFSLGTNVFHLLTGSMPKKTARNSIAIEYAGLGKRVSTMITKELGEEEHERFSNAIYRDLVHNRVVIYQMPPPRRLPAGGG